MNEISLCDKDIEAIPEIIVTAIELDEDAMMELKEEHEDDEASNISDEEENEADVQSSESDLKEEKPLRDLTEKSAYRFKSQWQKTGEVENRLDALVAIAKNFHSQAETRFTASQLTGMAFVAFMLSSLVHRPSNRSWWLPFADQLKAHRCRKSMALFVPGLFKLSKDNTRWSCAVSLKQHLHDVLHRDVLNKMTPDLQDTLELPKWHYNAPTNIRMKEVETSINFDLNLYTLYIDLSNKENFYWNRAVLFISHYGLTDASVEPFVNLMMHEVICKFSKWNKYCKDKESYQKLQAYGSNFFRDKNYIKDIIKDGHYNIIKSAHTRRQIENLLLPSYSEILSNTESVAFQHPLSSWKLIQSRACYVVLCLNNPHLQSDLNRFRQAMLQYIFNKFMFLPRIAKDRIWTLKKYLADYRNTSTIYYPKKGLVNCFRVTAYSHSKEPFYRRSAMGERHGEDFQPDEVLKVSPHFMKHVKKIKHCLSLMKSKSYGVRLEVRFTANNWDTLYCRTMKLAKDQLPVHINWYKSHVIWSFAPQQKKRGRRMGTVSLLRSTQSLLSTLLMSVQLQL
ncbi:hypothetical protein G6F64_008756 [Rhizopus arrhizus]|uniref:Uncharacterized protein n=1 Tax=Rhizopus oryzae TaxID=64495 RepID=A0A9P7BPZ4_RHIOR|nr:hypothetical protein G6F64_008756 [Rhizopus arrhizus]